ncbi:hypothetical protein OSJ14_19965 [Mycobacterium ulcerans]
MRGDHHQRLERAAVVRTVEVELDAAGASAVRVCTDTELTREQVQATLADHGDFAVVG